MTLDEFRADYDWRVIFMADGSGEPNMRGGVDRAGNPTTREVRAFTMDDVAEVVSVANGENDGPAWVGLFRTKDDVFLYVDASCDYTGWDCQAGASAEWHTSLDQAKAMIPAAERGRLWPEEAVPR